MQAVHTFQRTTKLETLKAKEEKKKKKSSQNTKDFYFNLHMKSSLTTHHFCLSVLHYGPIAQLMRCLKLS
jgi:hypothetical protein